MLQSLRNRYSIQWTFYLASYLLFIATLLRTIIIYWGKAELVKGSLLLLMWLILFTTQSEFSNRWSDYFFMYLAAQVVLTTQLLKLPIYPDYFITLFSILSMEIIQRLPLKTWGVIIFLFIPIMFITITPSLGTGQALAMSVFYTGVNVIMGSFALTVQRAQRAREENQALFKELSISNQQLQVYAAQIEELTIVKERNQLARELHDSVTQTIFSMTLTIKSALVLVDRDLSLVGNQLERLNQLTQSALTELRQLVSELGRNNLSEVNLSVTIAHFLQTANFPEDLQVEVVSEGSDTLTSDEVKNLARIVQEALNNIAKHAQSTHAFIRLIFIEPYCVEIEDNGIGFDPEYKSTGDHFGLSGMRERADEIGWMISIQSGAGKGTIVRVQKMAPKE